MTPWGVRWRGGGKEGGSRGPGFARPISSYSLALPYLVWNRESLGGNTSSKGSGGPQSFLEFAMSNPHLRLYSSIKPQ